MVLLCPFPLDRWLFVATGNESRFFVLDDLRQSLKVRLRGSRKLQIFAVSTMPASEAFDAARCLPERRPIFESLGRHWVGSRAKKRRSLRRCTAAALRCWKFILGALTDSQLGLPWRGCVLAAGNCQGDDHHGDTSQRSDWATR